MAIDGADFDCAVAVGGVHELLIDQPVRSSIQWVTARAANTTVGYASMDSILR